MRKKNKWLEQKMRSQHAFWMWDALLALGLLLSLETQLRSDQAILGPGEFLIALWITPLIVIEFWRFNGHLPRAFWDMARFWALFFFAQSVGTAVMIARTETQDWPLVLHDVIAYLLLAIVTCLATIAPDSARRLYSIQWQVVLFGSLSLVLQAGNAFGLFSLPNIDPWYWERLRGWSSNPNQMVLLCLLLALIALNLADCSPKAFPRFVAILCMCFAGVMGWLAQSEAYVMVVFLVVPLFLMIKMGRWVWRSAQKGSSVAPLVAAAVIGIPLALGILIPTFSTQNGTGTDWANVLLREGDTQSEHTKLRLDLWLEALQRGADSWMLGLGPGPHLEIPATVLAGRRDSEEPANISHPVLRLAPNFEAHSTILELFSQGGFLVVGGFIWLSTTAFLRAWRARLDGLAMLLFAVAVFGIFHVIFRHPLVWFVLTLGLEAQPLRLLDSVRTRPRFLHGPGSLRVAAGVAGTSTGLSP